MRKRSILISLVLIISLILNFTACKRKNVFKGSSEPENQKEDTSLSVSSGSEDDVLSETESIGEESSEVSESSGASSQNSPKTGNSSSQVNQSLNSKTTSSGNASLSVSSSVNDNPYNAVKSAFSNIRYLPSDCNETVLINGKSDLDSLAAAVTYVKSYDNNSVYNNIPYSYMLNYTPINYIKSNNSKDPVNYAIDILRYNTYIGERIKERYEYLLPSDINREKMLLDIYKNNGKLNLTDKMRSDYINAYPDRTVVEAYINITMSLSTSAELAQQLQDDAEDYAKDLSKNGYDRDKLKQFCDKYSDNPYVDPIEVHPFNPTPIIGAKNGSYTKSRTSKWGTDLLGYFITYDSQKYYKITDDDLFIIQFDEFRKLMRQEMTSVKLDINIEKLKNYYNTKN